jgi:hypothetical protein
MHAEEKDFSPTVDPGTDVMIKKYILEKKLAFSIQNAAKFC